MRGLNGLLLTSMAAAVTLGLTASQSFAQDDQANTGQRQRGGRQRQGNLDPAQFQQRMIERYRERTYFGGYPAAAADYAACRQNFEALRASLRGGAPA